MFKILSQSLNTLRSDWDGMNQSMKAMHPACRDIAEQTTKVICRGLALYALDITLDE